MSALQGDRSRAAGRVVPVDPVGYKINPGQLAGLNGMRAAIIYQHEARGTDLTLASAIDAHIETAKASQAQRGGRSPDVQFKTANGPPDARAA